MSNYCQAPAYTIIFSQCFLRGRIGTWKGTSQSTITSSKLAIVKPSFSCRYAPRAQMLNLVPPATQHTYSSHRQFSSPRSKTPKTCTARPQRVPERRDRCPR
uniref:Uncharacterized protein n=1 Tax=Triticum urartu TaxID=4572 RepID=A0A8R7P7J8_TRIUA